MPTPNNLICTLYYEYVRHAKISFNFLWLSHFISRCRIPECGEHGKLQSFNPEWLKNAIPATGSAFASCKRYAPVGLNTNGSLDSCPDFLFNKSESIPCNGFVYAKDNTVVYEVSISLCIFSYSNGYIIIPRWIYQSNHCLSKTNKSWSNIKYFHCRIEKIRLGSESILLHCLGASVSLYHVSLYQYQI